jgi:hypothetical protein
MIILDNKQEKEMRTMSTKTMISLALTGLFFTVAAAEAGYGYLDEAPPEKIDLCVAAIDEQANYEDASYVRHEVESRARATVGHKLKISTQVYDEVDGQLIREYRTLCAVSNRPEPVAFRMREAK